MRKPDDFASYMGNRLLHDEKNHKAKDELKEVNRLLGMITNEKRGVYDEILDVMNGKGGVFFLYIFGGTGKTFLWNILSAAIRTHDKIVVNTSSSGSVALLLPGGRTTHSKFSIPVNPDEYTSCNITLGYDLIGLLTAASPIVWDEAPMMRRHSFENLDRALRDIIRSKEDKPFGGKVVVFGGGFRQILPVISNGTRSETILSSLNSSHLCNHCKVLRLTKNMRLLVGFTDDQAAKLKEFSEWVLDVGNGKINEPNDDIVDIEIPEDLLVKDCGDPIETIVSEVHGKKFQRHG